MLDKRNFSLQRNKPSDYMIIELHGSDKTVNTFSILKTTFETVKKDITELAVNNCTIFEKVKTRVTTYIVEDKKRVLSKTFTIHGVLKDHLANQLEEYLN